MLGLHIIFITKIFARRIDLKNGWNDGTRYQGINKDEEEID